ncbi:cyclic nucleotide-binding domain-containing protein, partial [Escherichia coli]|uniref:cyclic nucleotide-binding domain-containing protein n=1 Tax=Escherichia coli TaxID=562 RepID=UPI00211A98F7
MKELKERERLIDYLRTFQLESLFPEQLIPYLSLYNFKEGEVICSQGEASEYLYILVKGKIKVYTTSS